MKLKPKVIKEIGLEDVLDGATIATIADQRVVGIVVERQIASDLSGMYGYGREWLMIPLPDYVELEEEINSGVDRKTLKRILRKVLRELEKEDE